MSSATTSKGGHASDYLLPLAPSPAQYPPVGDGVVYKSSTKPGRLEGPAHRSSPSSRRVIILLSRGLRPSAPSVQCSRPPQIQQRWKFSISSLTHCWRKWALEPVPPSVCPGLFSRNFVVPKKSGKVHPVINLKAVPGFLKTKCFKM